MGFRFRRRVRIAPGVFLNASKSGLGVSAGPRGLKAGVGPRGQHFSIGAPGTGLHYRKEYRHSGQSSRSRPSAGIPEQITVQLHTDGTVTLVGPGDEALSSQATKIVRERMADQIRTFLEAQCEVINGGMEAIRTLHTTTPSPRARLQLPMEQFSRPEPVNPDLRGYGILDRLIPRRREAVDADNAERMERFKAQRYMWETAKRTHADEQERQRAAHEQGIESDPAYMESVLANRFAALTWPRQTELSFEIIDSNRRVVMDIDLPVVDDIPQDVASLAARGLKVNIKKKSQTQIRKEYMTFSHAVVFRAVGEVFHVLPGVQSVIVSAYTQLADPATGHTRDTYLLSARIERNDWASLNFDHLDAIDVVACFDRFDLRRTMSKTGVFQPIEPIQPA